MRVRLIEQALLRIEQPEILMSLISPLIEFKCPTVFARSLIPITQARVEHSQIIMRPCQVGKQFDHLLAGIGFVSRPVKLKKRQTRDRQSKISELPPCFTEVTAKPKQSGLERARSNAFDSIFCFNPQISLVLTVFHFPYKTVKIIVQNR